VKAITTFFSVCLLIALGACGGSGSHSILQPGTLGWEKVSVPSATTQISFFAVNSNNHWFIADQSRGFYKSTDQGATWTAVNTGLSTTLGWTINVNPANGDLIASTFSGSSLNANPVKFYRSTNEGSSWTAIPSIGFSAATALTGCAFASNGNIACGGFWAANPNSGVWVSTDGGQTTTSASSYAAAGGSAYGLAADPVTGDLWMGTEQLGVFHSSDNGLTWAQASPPDTNVDPANGIRDGNVYGLTFDRSGNVLFGSQGGIWKSSKSSNGYSWTNVLKNSNTSAGMGMGRDSRGDLFYGHNPDPNDTATVQCSTDDGSTWVACDSGLPPGLQGRTFTVNPADGKLYAVITSEGTGSVYRTVAAVQ